MLENSYDFASSGKEGEKYLKNNQINPGHLKAPTYSIDKRRLKCTLELNSESSWGLLLIDIIFLQSYVEVHSEDEHATMENSRVQKQSTLCMKVW